MMHRDDIRSIYQLVLIFLLLLIVYKSVNIVDTYIRNKLFYTHEVGCDLETKDLREFFEDIE